MPIKAQYSFLLTAIVLGFFVFTACENDVKDIPNFTNKRLMLEEAKEVEAFLSQNGRMKGRLTAPLMYRYLADSPYVEFPNSLHVDFYNDSLVKESFVDALYGKYRVNEQLIYLKDSVVVLNSQKGDTLRCMDLWWDQNKEELYTEKPARIFQRSKTIYAKNGLRAAQNLSWWFTYSNSGTATISNDSLP
jgi:LPS export ABC transporter protein LptC